MALETLAIIPARGGSKGVPGKNLRHVAGRSLLAHAVAAAHASARLTQVCCSTDDAAIAAEARKCGISIVERPASLATDDSPVVLALLHALEIMERERGRAFDAVMVLQPTAPIREGADIDRVIEILEGDTTLDSVVSVCRVEDEHPARMYKLSEDGMLTSLWPEWEMVARQKLPAIYHGTGAIYACRRDQLVEHRKLLGARTKAYVMKRETYCNIDDERDYAVAELLVRRWKGMGP
jgi:CMP-N-acetylneuraminic acid synthetase